jgi:hypothetical protein
MIYSLYRRGFIMTIFIRLILYISYIAPIICNLNSLPSPLKTTARGFFVLFHIGIWSTSTTYAHLNLLHSLPSHLYPLTQCTCLTVLYFMSNIWVDVHGVSQCIPTVGILYFDSFNPFHYSPLPLYLLPLHFEQLSIYILRFSTFTDVMFSNITGALPLSFKRSHF